MKDKKDPIDLAMIEFLISITKTKHICSSEQAIADWMILGFHTGFRRNEYAQDTNVLNKNHTYERAKDNSARAFILHDFEFRKTKTNIHPNVKITDAQYVFITWRWQKMETMAKRFLLIRTMTFLIYALLEMTLESAKEPRFYKYQ